MDPSTEAMDSTNPYTVQGMAAIAAIITFLIIFTIFGNVLVIIAVLTSRSLRAPQNLFLVSLAAADILVATLIIPFSLANELMGYWYFGKTWCEVYLALDVLFCTSSIVHLCAISLDRYWSVSQAIEYNSKRTPRRIKCIILIVWTIAASISFPPLIYKGKTQVPPGSKPQCKLNEERWYILSSSIGSFFTPCLIMILVYLRIYHIAKRRTKKSSTNSTSRGVAEGAAHEDVPLHNVKQSPLHIRQSLQEANGHGSSIWHNDQKTMPSTAPSGQKTMADPNGNDGVIRDAEQHTLHSSSPSPQQTTIHPNGKCSIENMEIPAAEIDLSEQHHMGELQVKQGTTCTHCPPRALDTIAITGGQVALVRRYREPSPNMAKRKTHMNREKRFTFVLAVVIGVFVLCWFPFFFTYSLGAICPELCQVPNSLFQFFFWIGYCNSSLNPVIYTIFNQDFRRAFRRILCRQWTATAW